MTSIDEIFKGSFLAVDSGIKEGEKLKILETPEVDDSSFDKDYVVFPVEWNGEECMVRIGAGNANNLAKDFGTKEIEEWKGKEIYLKEIRHYKGLGKAGFIWSGVTPGTIICPKCSSKFNEKALERTKGHCPSCDAVIKKE